jgi:hypothetical protein
VPIDEATRECGADALAIIHQYGVSVQFFRQRDRSSLPVIEEREWQRGDRRRWLDAQPRRREIVPAAHRCRRARMTKLRVHHFRQKHGVEQTGKQVDSADQHQIVRRPGIRDGDRHGGSDAELVEVPSLALEISQRVGIEHAMRLEEAIQLGARFQPQQSTQVRLGQATRAILLGRERFQCASGQIATVGGQPRGQVVWKMDGQVHDDNLTWLAAGTNIVPRRQTRKCLAQAMFGADIRNAPRPTLDGLSRHLRSWPNT